CVQPEEEEIWFGNRLDDRRIRVSTGAKRSKKSGTGHYADDDCGGEEHVFPHRLRHERYTVFVCEFVVLLEVGGAAHDTSRHGPLINAELQHQEQVERNETDEQTGDHEDVQCKEARKRVTGDNRATH